jgi:hypothetical protein
MRILFICRLNEKMLEGSDVFAIAEACDRIELMASINRRFYAVDMIQETRRNWPQTILPAFLGVLHSRGGGTMELPDLEDLFFSLSRLTARKETARDCGNIYVPWD